MYENMLYRNAQLFYDFAINAIYKRSEENLVQFLRWFIHT